jgi:hypothetical protein
MPKDQKSQAKEDAACERCGSFDVQEFAGRWLCMDCIQLAGCGCAGHGTDGDE